MEMALKMRILLLNPDIITYMGFHVIYRRKKITRLRVIELGVLRFIRLFIFRLNPIRHAYQYDEKYNLCLESYHCLKTLLFSKI